METNKPNQREGDEDRK